MHQFIKKRTNCTYIVTSTSFTLEITPTELERLKAKSWSFWHQSRENSKYPWRRRLCEALNTCSCYFGETIQYAIGQQHLQGVLQGGSDTLCIAIKQGVKCVSMTKLKSFFFFCTDFFFLWHQFIAYIGKIKDNCLH